MLSLLVACGVNHWHWAMYMLVAKIITAAWTIMCMRPANDRRRYNVTAPLIGWAHAQNDPCWVHTQNDPCSTTASLPGLFATSRNILQEVVTCFLQWFDVFHYTSWHAIAFRITGPLWWEPNSHRCVNQNKILSGQQSFQCMETAWRSRDIIVMLQYIVY